MLIEKRRRDLTKTTRGSRAKAYNEDSNTHVSIMYRINE